MSEFSALEPLTIHIKQEEPKIDATVKNLISLLVSKTLSSDDDQVQINMEEGLKCAQALLFCIQSTELESVEKFMEDNPQNDRPGLERLDEVCQYRVIYELRKKVLENEKAKISKLFGKSYFTWTKCWPDVKANTLKRLEDYSPSIRPEVVQTFLKTYEKSLVNESDSENNNNSDIIWTTNLTKALEERQKKRIAATYDRLQEEMESKKAGDSNTDLSPAVEELKEAIGFSSTTKSDVDASAEEEV